MKERSKDYIQNIEIGYYFTQNKAGEAVKEALAAVDEELLLKKQLAVLLDTEPNMWSRLLCFPTSLAVTINHLSKNKVFECESRNGLNLGTIYVVGIESHLNDDLDVDGKIKRVGHPSFDRRTGNMFHSYATNLARRFGLDGVLLSEFTETSSLINVVKVGGVVLLSVDNQLIPRVSMPEMGVNKLKTSRHLIIIHGWRDGSFVYSDVFNPWEDKFSVVNLSVTPEVLDQFLLSPKMPHIQPRATVIAIKENMPQLLKATKNKEMKQTYVPHNPLLTWKRDLSLSEWQEAIKDVRERTGLSNWELVDWIVRNDPSVI